MQLNKKPIENKVVIIGGGVSGLFTLCKLIDLKIDYDCFVPISIFLIEKRSALGEGLAYANDHDSNLLNTAAGLLSNLGEKDHFCLNNQPSFLKWIRRNHSVWKKLYHQLSLETISKNSYLPRGLIGLYLRKILEFYINVAPLYKTTIEIIHDEATDIHVSNQENIKVVLKSNKTIDCNKVVLALGGYLRDPFSFSDHQNYLDNPWPKDNHLENLLASQSVAIIGSKLSALDTLSILKKYNYSGRIFLLSRTGFLPTVKSDHYHYSPKLIHHYSLNQLTAGFTQPLRLNDFINLIKYELEYAAGKKINWDNIFQLNRFNLSWLKWQIQLASNPTAVWQSVLAAIDEFVITAWQNLQPEDKIIFMKSFAFFWDTYRFSMPMDTAMKVWEMLENKQLIICSDLSSLSTTNNQYFEFSAFDRCNHKNINVKIERAVNATGINYNLSQVKSTLIQNIITKKIAATHQFGGFVINSSNFNLINYQNIFALGDLTKGTHFFTNSYLICSQQAAKVASKIFYDVNQ